MRPARPGDPAEDRGRRPGPGRELLRRGGGGEKLCLKALHGPEAAGSTGVHAESASKISSLFRRRVRQESNLRAGPGPHFLFFPPSIPRSSAAEVVFTLCESIIAQLGPALRPASASSRFSICSDCLHGEIAAAHWLSLKSLAYLRLSFFVSWS